MKNTKTLLLLSLLWVWGCSPTKETIVSTDDGLIEIQFLQVNDVYEIAPLPGDNRGGLARVATLKKQCISENKNTIAIMAGDFLSPSVIGTLDDENGNGIKGAQMIDVMNAAGIDLVTFGNHEFDLKEKDLQKRLDESEFEWVSSNVLRVEGNRVMPFFKNKNKKRNKKQDIPNFIIKTFTDEDGTSVRVGFFGVTLDSKQQPYVAYEDFMQRAEVMNQELSRKVDLIIPITHLDVADDVKLAKQINNFPLIMGGHDHDNMRLMVGSTVIAKADANAKTAFVHTLKFDARERTYIVYSELVKIDKNIAEDEIVKTRVDNWKKIAENDLGKKGFHPDNAVAFFSSPVDGRESTVRNNQCELGQMITNAIKNACSKKVDAAILNSGSIRVDDLLQGNLTEYDIIRILPYPSKILEVEMTGALLKKILETHEQKQGDGAFLQLNGIEFDEPSLTYKIGNRMLIADSNYVIGMNDFLLAGHDYKFLTRETEGIINIVEADPKDLKDLKHDLRRAVIVSLTH